MASGTECDTDKEREEACTCSCHSGGRCCSCCCCSGESKGSGGCDCHSGWVGALALIAVGALVMMAMKGGAHCGGHRRHHGRRCCQ